MKEFAIALDTEKKQPIYEQIYEALREAILQGRILKGEKLPSTRFEADYLQVSRSTVDLAYAQLVSEGYIQAEPYRGYFACDVRELYDLTDMRIGEKDEEKPSDETGRSYLVDFSPNGLELEHFLYPALGKIIKNLLLDAGEEVLRGSAHMGERNLRETICEYLFRARSVRCTPDQIVIGAGNEYLQMLLAQMLGTPCPAAMESPTYLRACRTFENLGFPVREIPMDSSGMRIDILKKTDARIAYVMPSHQFPTGIVMPMKRRLELLSWAAEAPNRYIIEDDYDSEFRYKGKPIPALQGIDRLGKVIYLGTFSKSIAPSVRVSYMVLPKPLLAKFREHCGFYACTVPNLMQQAICAFMREGYFEKNLNRMRARYKNKHDFMLSILREYPWVKRVAGENSGLHLLAEIETPLTETELVRACEKENVRVYGLSEYSAGEVPAAGERPVLLLGYGGLSEDKMRMGLEIIDSICKRA